ncbi:MAG TPA: hypothetical protein VLB29_13705 [Nocardioidaceae bacterium]|nr:hypothetical protein [Nocardioidaceae bacterium]
MSISVRDPAPYDRVEYADDAGESERAVHPRRVVVAAAVATLAVITGPLTAALLGFVDRVPVEEDSGLTPLAERVLDELPGAYESDGHVVVPAGTDPGVAWTGDVPPGRVDGWLVELGVNGLAPYGYLPAHGATPSWLFDVGPADQVYSDVGPLSFACMRWPGLAECSGALLMEHDGAQYVFRSGLGVEVLRDQVLSYRALEGGLPTQLVLGALPPGAVGAMVNFADDGGQIAARLSAPRGAGGETIWWLSVIDPVESVAFVDSDNDVVAEVSVAN